MDESWVDLATDKGEEHLSLSASNFSIPCHASARLNPPNNHFGIEAKGDSAICGNWLSSFISIFQIMQECSLLTPHA